MNIDIILIFVYSISTSALSIILILDLARIATFLFYDKDKNQVSKKLMVKPLVGTKIYSWQNILAACILIPSMYLILKVGVKMNIYVFYLLNAIFFFFITSIAFVQKKLQLEIESRKKAKLIFILEIGILIVLGILHFYLDFGFDLINNKA